MSLLLKQLNERRGALIARAREITKAATDENRGLTDEERNELTRINDEIDTNTADTQVELRSIANASAQGPVLTPQEKRDVARFDFGVLLNYMIRAAKGNPTPITGVEAEMLAQGEIEAREAGLKSSGIFLPHALVRRERRDMTATGQTTVPGDQGGMAIATEKRGLLDDFVNASVIKMAGATVFENLTGNVDFPRLTATNEPTKKAENAAADELSPTLAMLHLTPKRLPAYIDVSEQLLRQTSPTIETFLRRHITEQLLAVQERAFFHGDGVYEALGVANTPGIGSVEGGLNGGVITYEHLVALRSAVAINNALTGNLAYITNTPVEGYLAITPRVPSTDSVMILNQFGDRVAGVPLYITNAVSAELDKGTTMDSLSAIFFGNWADYYIAYWGGMGLELVRDKQLAITGMYSLVANSYYDGGVVRPKSFSAMLDVQIP